MNKKNVCICFGCSSSMLPAVANSIIGIEKYSKKLNASYLIFHLPDEKFNDNDIKAIHTITERIEFRKIDITKYENNLKNTAILSGTRYPLILFSKFFIFNLLNEFHNVLWLDADILVQDDISSIFKFKPMAWRPALIPMVNLKIKNNPYTFSDNDSRPNGGVIFVSDEIKQFSTLTDECFRIVVEEISDLSSALDEVAFGIINHKYSIGAQKLHPRYNCGCGWQNSHRALLVHSIGPNKFWNSVVRYSLFHKWKEHNDKWVKLGGTNLAGYLKGNELFLGVNLNYINTSLECSIYWNDVLSDISYPSNIIAEKTLFKPDIKFYIRGLTKKFYFSLEKVKSDVNQNKELNLGVCYESSDNNLLSKFIENSIKLDSHLKQDMSNNSRLSKIVLIENLQNELDFFFNKMSKFIETFAGINHL